jgi:hypothetical protein
MGKSITKSAEVCACATAEGPSMGRAAPSAVFFVIE